MGSTRDRLNKERIEAIATVLAESGLIEDDLAKDLLRTRNLGEARRLVEGLDGVEDEDVTPLRDREV